MNLSDKTRREQVLAYLEGRINDWVNGSELASVEVGGSEGLKRVRELRQEGYLIETRRHPNPKIDQWQYRLRTEQVVISPVRGEDPTIRTNPGRDREVRKLSFGDVIICPLCQGKGLKNGKLCGQCGGRKVVPWATSSR